jgi:hypothetical protein
LDGDFEATGLAIPMAVEADVTVNESGKTLNRVQNGLNLQLNSGSPVRGLVLFRNLHLTRICRDPLFAFTALDVVAPSLGGGGERRRRLPNSSSRRRRSPRVTDSPAPAQRRIGDVGRAITKICQKKARKNPENPQQLPTKSATDPEKETAKFGEYRTRRLVLEAWDKLPQT